MGFSTSSSNNFNNDMTLFQGTEQQLPISEAFVVPHFNAGYLQKESNLFLQKNLKNIETRHNSWTSPSLRKRQSSILSMKDDSGPSEENSWLNWDFTSRANYTTVGEFDYKAHTLSEGRKSWSMKDFNTTTRQKIEQFYDQHRLMYKKRAEFFKNAMENQTMESLKEMNVKGDIEKFLDPEEINETI